MNECDCTRAGRRKTPDTDWKMVCGRCGDYLGEAADPAELTELRAVLAAEGIRKEVDGDWTKPCHGNWCKVCMEMEAMSESGESSHRLAINLATVAGKETK